MFITYIGSVNPTAAKGYIRYVCFYIENLWKLNKQKSLGMQLLGVVVTDVS